MKNKIIFFIKNKYFGFFLFILGVVGTLGFAPFHLFPLTIFCYALVIYFFTLNIKNNGDIFLYSFYFSFGNHLGLLYWIAISFKTANMGGYFAGAIAVIFLSAFLSIFVALSFYFLFKYMKNFTSILFGIVFIFIFSLLDWLKGNILWGFPWTSISSLWSFNSDVLFPFSIFGVWGYSVITFSLVIAIYYISCSLKKSLFFIFPFIFCIIFLPKIVNTKKSFSETLSIRLVQPSIKQEDKWQDDKFLNNYKKLTYLITLDNYSEFDLIVLPETAISFDVYKLMETNHQINFGIDQIKNLIVGAIRTEKDSQGTSIFNSMFLIKKKFKMISYHDKLKLVPFGEFVPFRNLLNLDNLTQGSLDFQKGKELNLLKFSSNINILPLICYEVIFPALTKSLVGKYNLIVNITNDAWYKNSSGPYQHFAHTKIRAVMEGVPLVRVSNTGISGIIDSDGNVLKKLNLNEYGILDYELNLNSIKTIYSTYNETIFILIMLTLFLVICIQIFINKKNKN